MVKFLITTYILSIFLGVIGCGRMNFGNMQNKDDVTLSHSKSKISNDTFNIKYRRFRYFLFFVFFFSAVEFVTNYRSLYMSHEVTLAKTYEEDFSPEFNTILTHKVICNFSKRLPSSLSKISEIWFNQNISYIHVYKSGGTTIFSLLTKLAKKDYISKNKYNYTKIFNDNLSNKKKIMNNIRLQESKFFEGYVLSTTWDKIHNTIWDEVNKQKLYKVLSDNLFLFTFVRDPLDHLLSSIYQLTLERGKTEIIKDIGCEKKKCNTDKKYLSCLLNYMKKRQDKQYETLYLNNSWSDISRFAYPYQINIHLYPQTLFLVDDKWNKYDFNFIGNTKKIKEDFFYVLKNLLKIKINTTQYDNIIVHKKDRHHKNYQRDLNHTFLLDRKNLSSQQINDICELYWIDFV